ncbi:MAG: iron-sulfur cluster repair di-iron protein [Thermoflavifilum sp.]|nr:iron-sulfur cluster repair di-iron protein [Thermoflavifilum sp.]
MAHTHQLDVTQIPPKLKHPTIFEHFDALQEGDSFSILNDHDPKPLYYQLLAERGDTFTWEYKQQGPQWWEVEIGKKKVNKSLTVGQIAATDQRKAEVLQRLGIDFCCHGNHSLDEACKAAGVDVEEVKRALAEAEHLPVDRLHRFDEWELDFLADYIVNIHHRYVSETAPILKDLSEKVAQRHGANHPELLKIAQDTAALMAEMLSHQVKEERILFPFIKEMVKAKSEHKPFQHPPFGSIENPINMMVMDHDEAARLIKAIHTASKNYTLPEDACESYRLLYLKLEEFENDLYQHIHLENNILFPKAIALEEENRQTVA